MELMPVNLTALRINQGLSLRAAAKEIGVSGPTLGRAESGGTMPHPKSALKIATFYGYKVTDIWPVDTAAAAA